jgi:NAD(P)-dependent dehydrogenase (short-subunit alcohol dehydrogenase family)
MGRRVIVTGGAAGIGRACVDWFAAEGSLVVCLDLDVPDDLPAGAVGLLCDVSDDDSVRAAVGEAATQLGGIDVLVNNAGIGAAGDVTANQDAEWLRLYDVNVVGMARVTRASLPHLRRSPDACIVNMSSIVAIAGLPDRAAYSATKGAVQALTMAMAMDHAREGIRVNCVNPSTVDTPWVRRLVAFLARPGSPGLTGVSLPLDGGMFSLRPRR